MAIISRILLRTFYTQFTFSCKNFYLHDDVNENVNYSYCIEKLENENVTLWKSNYYISEEYIISYIYPCYNIWSKDIFPTLLSILKSNVLISYSLSALTFSTVWLRKVHNVKISLYLLVIHKSLYMSSWCCIVNYC